MKENYIYVIPWLKSKGDTRHIKNQMINIGWSSSWNSEIITKIHPFVTWGGDKSTHFVSIYNLIVRCWSDWMVNIINHQTFPIPTNFGNNT